MLSGSAVFRWCELYVGMLVSAIVWFLHPLFLLIDLGGVSLLDISI
jgi:hypothetical protein